MLSQEWSEVLLCGETLRYRDEDKDFGVLNLPQRVFSH